MKDFIYWEILLDVAFMGFVKNYTFPPRLKSTVLETSKGLSSHEVLL